MSLEAFLESVRGRSFAGTGVGLASAYALAVAPCLADGACQAQFFGAKTLGDWSVALKTAGRTLVYCDGELTGEGGLAPTSPTEVRSWGQRFAGATSALTPGACMDLDFYVSSNRKDRDADVLEPSGAVPDPACPLLWQHLALQPIGRMLEFLPVVKDARHANRELLPGRATIIDSELGRDVAKLVEFRVLRVSHGFVPLDYGPLKPDKERDKSDTRVGWHVRRYGIMEVSLVSVPSCEDAVITAWAQQKLHHPLVTAWAEELRRQLPVLVKGGWDGASQEPLNVTIQFQAPPAPTGHKCTCGGTPEPESVRGDKPLPGEHSCRQADPAKYDKFRRTNKKTKEGKKYGLIFGRVKGKAVWELQTIRYPTSDWTAEEAKKACAATEGGTFEAAAKDYLPPQIKDAGAVLANRDGLLMPYLEGSWEATEAELEEDARQWLVDHNVPCGPEIDVTLLGTWQGAGVVCLRRRWDSYSSSSPCPRYACYQGAWKDGDSGPEWDGAPEPVDLVLTVGRARPDDDDGSMPDLGAAGELTGAALERAEQELYHRALQGAFGRRRSWATAGTAARELLGRLLKGERLDGRTASLLAGELSQAGAQAEEAALAELLR